MIKTERMTLREIAAEAGVSPPAVSNWRKRHQDTFPQPDEEGTFDRQTVLNWLAHRPGTVGVPRRIVNAKRLADELLAALGDSPNSGLTVRAALALLTTARLSDQYSSVGGAPLTLAVEAEREGLIPAGALTEPLQEAPFDQATLSGAYEVARGLFTQESPVKVFDAVLGALPRKERESATGSRRLAAFLAGLVPSNARSVFDATAGTGRFLSAVAGSVSVGRRFEGMESDRRNWQICAQRLVFTSLDPIPVEYSADPLQAAAGPFDLVVVQPELGTRSAKDTRMRDQFGFGTPLEEYEWIGRSVQTWAPAGTTIAALSANSLFASAPTAADFRRQLLVEERVQAVFLLPKGLLGSASAPAAVWVIGPEGSAPTVFMYRGASETSEAAVLDQATQEYRAWVADPQGYTPVPDVTSVVRVLEVVRTDSVDLNPTRWVMTPPSQDSAQSTVDQDITALDLSVQAIADARSGLTVQFVRTDANVVSLKDMVRDGDIEVHRGPFLPRRAREAGPVGELSASELPKLQAVFTRLAQIPDHPAGFVEPDSHAALRTQPGDVLFSAQGDIAATVDPDGGLLVCAPLWIIRPINDRIDPYLLALLLSGQRSTAAALTGSGVNRIRDVRDIRIPVLPPAAAAEAATLARTLFALRQSASALSREVEGLFDSLCDALFAGLTPRAGVVD